jgi:hypothetical protein
MPLETATYINSLVTSNPDGAGDARSTLDDHIRLIKAALKRTFPNIDGQVSVSVSDLLQLVGVNQPIATQFANLGPSPGVAYNALSANIADFATTAQSAGFASVALESGDTWPIYFGVANSNLSLSATKSSIDALTDPRISLSRSGLYVARAVIYGLFNNTALSATLRVTVQLHGESLGAGTHMIYTNGAPSKGISASFSVAAVAAQVFKGAGNDPVTYGFPGPSPGPVPFLVELNGLVNLTASSTVVTIGTLLRFIPEYAGQVVTRRRGSYLSLERAGNSIDGGLV